MYNGQKIKNIIELKGLKQIDVYKSAGINEGTFFSITSEKGNPKADKLELIADFLQCSIDDFFDRKIKVHETSMNVSGSGNKVQNGVHNVMVENQAKEIEHLQLLLKEKEVLIKTKEMQLRDKDKIIALLENKK